MTIVFKGGAKRLYSTLTTVTVFNDLGHLSRPYSHLTLDYHFANHHTMAIYVVKFYYQRAEHAYKSESARHLDLEFYKDGAIKWLALEADDAAQAKEVVQKIIDIVFPVETNQSMLPKHHSVSSRDERNTPNNCDRCES